MSDHKHAQRIDVVTRILKANDRLAEENRRRFEAAGVYVVDLVSSPGAGKTALLEATIPRLEGRLSVGVILGDVATTRDAERIAPLGVPLIQITTESFGGACHLEASSLVQALDRLDLDGLDLLFVENVGNLICPAEFDLGQQARVVVLSLAEGEDKPIKYPLAFRTAELVLVNKVDLREALDADMSALREHLGCVRPKGSWLELSARTGEGLDGWTEWLTRAVKEQARRDPAPACSASTGRRHG